MSKLFRNVPFCVGSVVVFGLAFLLALGVVLLFVVGLPGAKPCEPVGERLGRSGGQSQRQSGRCRRPPPDHRSPAEEFFRKTANTDSLHHPAIVHPGASWRDFFGHLTARSTLAYKLARLSAPQRAACRQGWSGGGTHFRLARAGMGALVGSIAGLASGTLARTGAGISRHGTARPRYSISTRPSGRSQTTTLPRAGA